MTLAVFSEVEGNIILAGLEKAGATLIGEGEIRLREGTSLELTRREKIYRKLSETSWLRYPLLKKEDTASTVWYNDQGDLMLDDNVSSTDQSDNLSMAYTETSLSSVFGKLTRGRKPPASKSESVTDGYFNSYFSLPRRLFKSELNLYNSSRQATLRCDEGLPVLASGFSKEENLDPGFFGLIDDPGVLRLHFDDYPDSVYVTENFDRPDFEVTSNKDWIRKSYDELDININRADVEVLYNRVAS